MNAARAVPVEGSRRPEFGGTERDFRLLRQLIHKEAGIHLTEAKHALLQGRLANRLRALGLDSFGDYYARLEAGDPLELVRMIDCICTNETHFFREPQHFRFLEDRIFPEWEARVAVGEMEKRVRVWSAASSTGQEPYSLAMVLLARFPPSQGWTVEILATDLSTRVLDAARVGLYPIERSSEIPEPYLKRFMLRGTGSMVGKMKAGPEVRSVVTFARANLNAERYPVAGPFDLVFCRNVLIYFAAEAKPRVIRQLQATLGARGYLFVGHSETLAGISSTLKPVIPTVYANER